MTSVVVLAKRPVPGLVKTRLTPPYTPGQAARLASAALQDTLAAVLATPGVRPVLCLGHDGPTGGPATARWERPGLLVLPQRGDGLAERIAAAFEDVVACESGPVVLVGMDTPQLTPTLLTAATTALDRADAVLGPATDGGWWLLGLRRPDRRLLEGVPMSTSRTGAAQAARLTRAGLRVAAAPLLRDVDCAADAAAVARLAPHTAFARLVADLAPRSATVRVRRPA